MAENNNEVTFRHPTTGQVVAHYFQESDGRATVKVSSEKIPLETLSLDVYCGDERLVGELWDGKGNALFRDGMDHVVMKISRACVATGPINGRWWTTRRGVWGVSRALKEAVHCGFGFHA